MRVCGTVFVAPLNPDGQPVPPWRPAGTAEVDLAVLELPPGSLGGLGLCGYHPPATAHQHGDPLAGLPAAEPWTPRSRR